MPAACTGSLQRRLAHHQRQICQGTPAGCIKSCMTSTHPTAREAPAQGLCHRHEVQSASVPTLLVNVMIEEGRGIESSILASDAGAPHSEVFRHSRARSSQAASLAGRCGREGVGAVPERSPGPVHAHRAVRRHVAGRLVGGRDSPGHAGQLPGANRDASGRHLAVAVPMARVQQRAQQAVLAGEVVRDQRDWAPVRLCVRQR